MISEEDNENEKNLKFQEHLSLPILSEIFELNFIDIGSTEMTKISSKPSEKNGNWEPMPCIMIPNMAMARRP